MAIERLLYHFSKAHCYTYFRITGDFDPEQITSLLNLAPDEIWQKGDRRENGTTYGFSSWRFGRCDEYDGDVAVQMMRTIQPLMEKIPILQKMKKQEDVFYVLEVVAYIRFDEASPSLAPSQEVMRFCCDTETEMDIDLYVICPDECHKGPVWSGSWTREPEKIMR